MSELIWNEKAKAQFKTYLTHCQSKKKPLFLILIWPSGIGKASFLVSFAKEMLWTAMASDFFWMRDLTQELWKPHTIQVETPTTLKTIPIDEKLTYENKGVREINIWLQSSAISNKKVLLIENLERMTNSAMNAFLKTCEEPLPNRFLFATAEHENWILPTILSRAMVIRFSALSDYEITTYLEQELHFQWTKEEKDLLIDLSLGKPWFLKLLLEKKGQNPEFFQEFLQIFELMNTKEQRTKKQQILKKIDENWFLELFLTVLIKKYTDQGNEDKAEEWLKVKQRIGANVSQENALRYGILS